MFRSAESSVAEIRNRYEEDVLLRQFGKGEIIGFLIPFAKSSQDGEVGAVNHLQDIFEVFLFDICNSKGLATFSEIFVFHTTTRYGFCEH